MRAHDLVIGGSGMLAGLVEAIARSGRRASAVARGAARLQHLAARHPNIHPIAADYRDDAAFDSALVRAQEDYGGFERCAAWMQDDSKARALRIARQIADVYCQVLGSASADPARPEVLAEWQRLFQPLKAPRLRLAVLGFVAADGASRWLTNDEISGGVLRALESEAAVTVVGTVTPWSARP